MIKTDICDLLQIEYPIFQGGMAWLGTAELAAAVSVSWWTWDYWCWSYAS